MTRFIKSYNKFSIQNQSQQKNVRFRLLIFRVRILMYFVLLGKLVFIVRVVEWLVFFQRMDGVCWGLVKNPIII